jgi:hypothetical protein
VTYLLAQIPENERAAVVSEPMIDVTPPNHNRIGQDLSNQILPSPK